MRIIDEEYVRDQTKSDIFVHVDLSIQTCNVSTIFCYNYCYFGGEVFTDTTDILPQISKHYL